jgi:hypothetical protein
VIRDDIPTADDPRAIRLGVGDNRISELNYDPDIELLLEIDEHVGLSDLYFEDELAALVEADRREDKEEIEPYNPESSTKEVNTEDFEFDCKCPKCGFEFTKIAK